MIQEGRSSDVKHTEACLGLGCHAIDHEFDEFDRDNVGSNVSRVADAEEAATMVVLVRLGSILFGWTSQTTLE